MFLDTAVISRVRYTNPFNLTGQPAASLPAGFTAEGHPVGLQLVAKTFRETDIFRAAAALETAKPWSRQSPAKLRWISALPSFGTVSDRKRRISPGPAR